MLRRKDTVIQDNEFPFDIFDATGAPVIHGEPAMHNHDCLELNYVISGRGYYLIDGKKYELHPGDICILNNQEYHMGISTHDLMLKVLVFNVDLVWNGSQLDYMYLKAFFECKDTESRFLSADLEVNSSLTDLFFEIEKEWKEKKPGYRIVIKADLMKMLGIIYRHYEESRVLENNNLRSWHNYHSVITAVDYINTHYQDQILLQDVADMVHMSKNYFSAVFSEIMQIPFKKYVMEKRLRQACILLRTTELSVTDIALETGFDSVSYFNKAFKNAYEKTPGNYRTEMKTSNSVQ